MAICVGFALAYTDFRGRRALISVFNTLLSLPAVVVGLLLYMCLSRSGPLGDLRLLFTSTAMHVIQHVYRRRHGAVEAKPTGDSHAGGGNGRSLWPVQHITAVRGMMNPLFPLIAVLYRNSSWRASFSDTKKVLLRVL